MANSRFMNIVGGWVPRYCGNFTRPLWYFVSTISTFCISTDSQNTTAAFIETSRPYLEIIAPVQLLQAFLHISKNLSYNLIMVQWTLLDSLSRTPTVVLQGGRAFDAYEI